MYRIADTAFNNADLLSVVFFGAIRGLCKAIVEGGVFGSGQISVTKVYHSSPGRTSYQWLLSRTLPGTLKWSEWWQNKLSSRHVYQPVAIKVSSTHTASVRISWQYMPLLLSSMSLWCYACKKGTFPPVADSGMCYSLSRRCSSFHPKREWCKIYICNK